MPDVSIPIYSEGWSARSEQAIASTGGCCVFCRQAKPKSQMVAHHLLNQRLGFYLRGHQGISGWELIPACRSCHMKHCHDGQSWIEARSRRWRRNRFHYRWLFWFKWLVTKLRYSTL